LAVLSFVLNGVGTCEKKSRNAFFKLDTHCFQIENNLDHNHETVDERSLVQQKVSNSVKREAVEWLCERPSKIIYSEISPDLNKQNTNNIH